ncbi:MAG: metallopeptidase TldD-related protein [Cyanobacteria bacterium P01_H01_bin.121]
MTTERSTFPLETSTAPDLTQDSTPLDLEVPAQTVQDLRHWSTTFQELVTHVTQRLPAQTAFQLTLAGESGQFIRFNQAKVRQIGTVLDGTFTLTLMQQQRTCSHQIPFTGLWELDWPRLEEAIASLLQTLPQLPTDPHQVLPQAISEPSRSVYRGQLLAPDQATTAILTPVQGLDFVGIYAGGTIVQAQADSAGNQHWFETDSFSLDYSIFHTEQQAVKGTYAGRTWDQATYVAKVAQSRQLLGRIQQPVRRLPRGRYRTYLAPAAVAELVLMLSWEGLSELALQQGISPFLQLRHGYKTLSPALSVQEDLSLGWAPRFNEAGELTPPVLPLIEHGALINTSISPRTAREYDLVSNGAIASEDLRSPAISPGTLAEADILQALDTGLLIANLHYLNWSDQTNGRITGMTRYACFWVENGKIANPIEHLRFDESLFNFWGDNLLALTETTELIPNIESYGQRALGCSRVPGMLVEDFTYTL